MKKFYFIFSLIISANTIFSQIIINKTEDIVYILGRKYYIHTVEKGQTLFSISKTYSVPIEQIILINKENISTIKIGDILRIPVIDQDYVSEPITKIDFKSHKVEKGESLFGIAQKYNVSQDEIIKYNPQVVNGIRKRMVLRIPIVVMPQIELKDEFFTYHIAKNGEDIQTIAQLYGISEQEILEFNSQPIEPGVIVTIPLKSLTKEQIYILKFNKSITPDFLDIDPDFFEDPSCQPCNSYTYNNEVFNIGVLLPIFIEENLPLSQEAIGSPQKIKYFSHSEIFIDFLQGMLVASKDFEQLGVNLKISIYDTKADENIIKSLLESYDFTKMDLIIGPAFTKNYGMVSEFCKKNQICVVSPFSNKEETLIDNPFVFQVNPSHITLIKLFAQYISQFCDTSAIAVISDNSLEQNQAADSFHYYFSNYCKNPDSIDFKIITYSKFLEEYQNNLSQSKTNFVFIPTSNNSQFTAIINNLNALVTGFEYKIIAFIIPPIEQMTDVQVDWIGNLNIHHFTNTIETDFSVKKTFDNAYKLNFGKMPSKYSYLGYDVLYHFVMNLKLGGKHFQLCLDKDKEIKKGIFYDFDFVRVMPNNGFENRAFHLIKYNTDLSTQYIPISNAPIKSFFD